MGKPASLPCPDSSGTELQSKELLIDISLPLEPAEWPECCVYRIPKKLRNVNQEAYTPKVVAIGPFHHGQKEFKKMGKQKLRYLREFCYRTKNTLVELKRIIAENEVRIHRRYSETFELGNKEFINMIVLDAIFIINLFWWNFHDRKDNISRRPLLEFGIRHDLMLLENQLPFFVMEILYKAGPQIEVNEGGQSKKLTFPEASRRYFSAYLKPQLETKIEEVEIKGRESVEVNGRQPRAEKSQGQEVVSVPRNLYCATKLQRAGVKFKKVKNRGLLEIKFQECWWLKRFPILDVSWLLTCLPCLKCFPLERMQHILEVPPFEVDDDTEALIRNLMALEQCHYPSKAYFCNYIWLLDSLIETERDVDLLVDKGVIVNNLGSNLTVATLINKLGHHIVVQNSCFSDLSLSLKSYYESPLNQIVASLASTYFEDFWKGTATVVGLIVLAFTFWGFLRPFVLK